MLSALVLGFVAGLMATPHCLGMCGGFPLYLSGESSRGGAILRQTAFIGGKTSTYAFLGALASAFGAVVFKNSALMHGAPYLKLTLGLLVVLFGLTMLGLKLPKVGPANRIADTPFMSSLFSGLMGTPSPAAAGVLGLAVGFLPCPLPMGMLAVAAASHSVLYGIALMVGVGIGTAPSLMAVGLCGTGLNRRFSRVGMRAAGMVVLAIGLLMVGRAATNTRVGATHRPIPSCCAESSVAR